jgi:hypothetical protein
MHVSGNGVANIVDALRALALHTSSSLKDDFSVLDAFVACASQGGSGRLAINNMIILSSTLGFYLFWSVLLSFIVFPLPWSLERSFGHPLRLVLRDYSGFLT